MERLKMRVWMLPGKVRLRVFSRSRFVVLPGESENFACNNFEFLGCNPALNDSISHPIDAPQSAVKVTFYLLEVLTHSSSTSVIMAIYSRSA